MKQVEYFGAYEIPAQQLSRLLSIVGSAHAFSRHDLMQPLTTIMRVADLLRRFDNSPSNQQEGLIDLANMLSESVSRAATYLRSVTFDESDPEWAFTSSPAKIAASILTEGNDTAQIVPSSSSSLRILFPSNALYAMVAELVRNAQRHSGALKVALEWSLDSDAFVMSVHDTGRALESSMTDRFVAVDFLEALIHSGGLSIVRRITHCAGGLTLLRRSRILGGAEFAIRVPIEAFSNEESPR